MSGAVSRLGARVFAAMAALTLGACALAAPPPWASGTYGERAQAIRGARAEDADALEELLSIASPPEGISPDELNSLKNDAASFLMALPNPPPGLAARFLAAVNDPATGAVWRDFCVQFLGQGFRSWTPADRKAAAALLADVARREKGVTGGTALIALAGNAAAPEIGANQVRSLALDAVRDPGYGDPGRVTALQVCAQLGVKESLPEARVMAASASCPATLRMSAIAALGALGDASDAPALKSWSHGANARLRAPARAALLVLESRLSKKPSGVPP